MTDGTGSSSQQRMPSAVQLNDTDALTDENRLKQASGELVPGSRHLYEIAIPSEITRKARQAGSWPRSVNVRERHQSRRALRQARPYGN
jgi:hypothetical protein